MPKYHICLTVYCMHHGIGLQIIEVLQTFPTFPKLDIFGLFYSYVFVCFNIILVQMKIVEMKLVQLTGGQKGVDISFQ